jgi:hypothetical protein
MNLVFFVESKGNDPSWNNPKLGGILNPTIPNKTTSYALAIEVLGGGAFACVPPQRMDSSYGIPRR